jgi:hypothetical protein
MCDKLRERSLVTKLFISPRSDADDELHQRDTKIEENLLEEILNINGNTQGKFVYILMFPCMLKILY